MKAWTRRVWRLEAWLAAATLRPRGLVVALVLFAVAGFGVLVEIKYFQDVFKDNAEAFAWGRQFLGGYGRHPVLTGWFAGPKADTVARLTEAELVEMGLTSLAEIFNMPVHRISNFLAASQAINWGNDPFARGAYSYATPKTRDAQSALKQPDRGAVFFSGEAVYAGPDMGTVEAALASGWETAQTILTAEPT